MVIKKVNFLKSSAKIAQMPESDLPEFAFIGRSNVGKSSLINRLCNRKDLARISNTPGKTRTVNHFEVDGNWLLADLPGYGFAKVSKSDRVVFAQLIKDYLTKRKNLYCAFLLVDSRIPPQKNDLEMMRFLGTKGIPHIIVYTKIDDVSLSEKSKNFSLLKKAMEEEWEEMPAVIETSSVKGKGLEKIMEWVIKAVDGN